jgi:protein YIPF5/7
MSIFNQNPYNPSFPQQQQQRPYYQQQPGLDFYSGDTYGYGSRPNLEGNVVVGNGGGPSPGFGGSIQPVGPWWAAFGTGGFEGEPPLLQGSYHRSSPVDTPFRRVFFLLIPELGINFSHIGSKSLTVLNPLRKIDEHIMDDADLAGPIIFCFCFALFLLFVSWFSVRMRFTMPYFYLRYD